MRITFIWPGKTKDERLRSLIADYFKRLERFVRCEVIETREFTATDPARLEKESARLLNAVPTKCLMVLLDVNGSEWTSQEFAEELRGWENNSIKEVAIVVGGQDGFDGTVKERAQKRWRLSRLTLTHEMARMLAVEQLYRAYAINRGLPYQK